MVRNRNTLRTKRVRVRSKPILLIKGSDRVIVDYSGNIYTREQAIELLQSCIYEASPEVMKELNHAR
jgi:hypothetical protein